jgi:NAD(P)-dependent dehydrogenase (short-subunit alcohol dehydrogenase family)
MNNSEQQRIWLITGISSGLGKSLAEAVIAAGDFVVGTFRQQVQADVFNNQHKDEALALVMDITNAADVARTAATVQDRFGRLDVLVNNAGYGMAGAIEETSEAETRAIFEANFFGTLALTQAVLPILRGQRSGHIVQVSSHGGIKAFAGFGIYNASKFALEGMSEALAQEVAPLGIKLTIVEPGPFRTGFADRSFLGAAQHIEDYKGTAGVFRERMQAVNGNQEGDPDKAASAIIAITRTENPPLRLPLGKVPMTTIQMKLDSVKQDMEAWRAVAEGAVFG